MEWQKRTSILLGWTDPKKFMMMTDEEAGKFLKNLITYADTGEVEDYQDRFMAMILSDQISQINKNWESYDKTCAANRENGKKGGRPRKNKTERLDSESEVNPEKPMGFDENPKNPDKDKEQDKDKDCDKDMDKKKGEEKNKKEKSSVVFFPSHLSQLFPCEIEGVNAIDVDRVNDYILKSGYSYLTETAVRSVYQLFADGAYRGADAGKWRQDIDNLEKVCRQQNLEKMRAAYPD